MASEEYLRTEKVHIDESSRNATSSVQWFAENKNEKGNATHPITHNNKLTLYINGQDGFAAIATDIKNAKESIDLVCWGFDPGMELVRNGITWPRGETYGDLLIAAGRRGVQIRLLVWYSYTGGKVQKHMPGYSHGTDPWRVQDSDLEIQQLNAKHSLALLLEHARNNRHKREWNTSGDKLAAMAREEYCHSWYKAAFKGKLRGISIRTRDGDFSSIGKALKEEKTKPSFIEKKLVKYSGTHHQKPILIDFAYNEGQKAVGYVMGLNSVTDYWDTSEHLVENPLREYGGAKTEKEQAQGVQESFDFETLKPYRDYACRIAGGRALVPLYENFEGAWKRAGGAPQPGPFVCSSPPAALLRKATGGDSTAQIVRTQPEENDFTIKDIYFNATGVAAAGTGYLYMENQYFQYQDWAEHLLAIRKKVITGWKKACAKIGKTIEDLPILHVFVVIPVPERAEMIPRTYDTLGTLGQQDGMTGQTKKIESENERVRNEAARATKPYIGGGAYGWGTTSQKPLPEVIDAANKINKPSQPILEDTFGLRVCVAMLNACEFHQARRQWRYREIYIHSKLLLIDDSFFTLGSANLNQRSMVGDSEINLATNDIRHAAELRKRIWSQLTGGKYDGGNCTPSEVETTFRNWQKLMRENKSKQKAESMLPQKKQMDGFIVPLDDGRSSTTRFG